MRLQIALSALIVCNVAATDGGRRRRPRIGLTLNAGSNTAGNAMSGFMRGFLQQTVEVRGRERTALEAMKYISSVSAGGIPNLIYHYQNSSTANVIFDAAGPTDPSQITEEVLSASPEGSIFSTFTVETPVAVTLQTIVPLAVQAGMSATPFFYQFQFLQNFGIEMNQLLSTAEIRDDVRTRPILTTSWIGPSQLFPDFSDNVINRAVFGAHNQTLEMLEMVSEDDTAFYDIINEINTVTGGAFAADVRRTDLEVFRMLADENGFQLNLPAFGTDTEYTVPLRGRRATFDAEGDPNGPFVYKGPFIATYDELLSKGAPVTLQTLLGMSGDLLGLFPGLRPLVGPAALPLSLPITTFDNEIRDIAFTDGGIIDISGLAALIKKRPDKVIVCFNGSPPAIRLELGPEISSTISFQVMNSFGNILGLVEEENPESLFAGITLAHLFDLYSNGENQFVKLVETFESLREAGEPLVATLEGLDVVENRFWGIRGGWKVDVTFIHMFEVPQKFADALPEDIAPPPAGRDKIEFGRFTNPLFSTVPNNAAVDAGTPLDFMGITTVPAIGFELEVQPARMTQILTSWVIDRAWDGLVGSDGELKFGGFREIFEEGN